MKCTEEFRSYFGEDRLADLDEDDAIIYGLDAELRLALLNEAWYTFARLNDAPKRFFETYDLGGSYLDCVPRVLRPFFEEHLRHSLEQREPWSFDYQCPSPTLYREFRMQVLPMADGAGCLVTNARLIEIPHQDDAESAHDLRAAYLDKHKFIVQCAHCRRTRRADLTTRWDWVPQFVRTPPPKISHGLCPACSAYFYPASM